MLGIAAEADGRKWRARVGDFQTEAEFVETRGDMVVLKRADGIVIQVPLEKLCEDDVRYIEQLQNRSTDNAAPFRYGFKPGVTYNYAYRLGARLGKDQKDGFLVYGGVSYTMLPADGATDSSAVSKFDVTYSGSHYMKGFGKLSTGDASRLAHISKVEHSPLVFNSLGEYISGKAEANVPFMFSQLAEVALDPIEDGKDSWIRENRIKLVTKKSSRGSDPFLPGFRRPPPAPRLGPSRGPNSIRRPSPRDPFSRRSGSGSTSVESEEAATERYEYRWGEVVDNEQKLHRHYVLKSADGEFQAEHTSVIVMDRVQRIPLRMDGKGAITITSDNITVKLPIKMAYHRTDANAWRVSAYNRPIPDLFVKLDEAKSREFRDKMRNGTPNQRRDLMYYIKGFEPAEYRAEIAAAIAKALGSDDFWQRYAAAQSIRRWGTEKEALAVLEAVKRGGEGEYYNWVLVAAGRFPSAEAAEAVAAAFPKNLEPATAALIEMGPVAEDATIKLAASSDGNVRRYAAAILGKIGTEKSLAVLSKLKSDDYAPAKTSAEKAYGFLQARMDNP